MDKAQSFIKECLFTKNFDNPNKPIDEDRLHETLLLMPTDGGQTGRLRRARSSLKINAENIKAQGNEVKHPNYRSVNKNSKIAMRDFIHDSRKASMEAKRIAAERKIQSKAELRQYIKDNNSALYERLPKYDAFLPMYKDFWVSYMRDILDLSQDTPVGSTPKLNAEAALMRLSMADYNGSRLRVTHSKNKNMIGIEGIVVWDSQKTFIMIVKGKLVDEIKSIPKRGTVFGFQIPINEEEALEYSILGDRFKYRSVDRASRKFKARRCDDMLHYVLQEN